MAALLEIDPAVIGIVSSGYSDNPVVSDFAAYGFTAIAPKPYRSRDLLKTVKAVASRKRATGKTGPSAP